MRPTRRPRASSPLTPPYSALHRVGFAWPPCHHDAGALLPHHFTVAAFHDRGRGGRAVSFLWHFPEGFPRWTLSSTLLCGVRTFLEERVRRRLHATTWAAIAEYNSGDSAPYSSRSSGKKQAAWCLPPVVLHDRYLLAQMGWAR